MPLCRCPCFPLRRVPRPSSARAGRVAANPLLPDCARPEPCWFANCSARSILLDTGTPAKCSRSRFTVQRIGREPDVVPANLRQTGGTRPRTSQSFIEDIGPQNPTASHSGNTVVIRIRSLIHVCGCHSIRVEESLRPVPGDVRSLDHDLRQRLRFIEDRLPAEPTDRMLIH